MRRMSTGATIVALLIAVPFLFADTLEDPPEGFTLECASGTIAANVTSSSGGTYVLRYYKLPSNAQIAAKNGTIASPGGSLFLDMKMPAYAPGSSQTGEARLFKISGMPPKEIEVTGCTHNGFFVGP